MQVKGWFLVLGAVAVVNLVGCTGLGTRHVQDNPPPSLTATSQQEDAVTEQVSAPVEPPVATKAAKKTSSPPTNLTAAMLYRLLVAEVAGQRGQLDLAVQQYLRAARESRDSKVVERAARIAVYARDDAAALDSAKLWTEISPADVEAHQVAAAMYIRAGKVAEARTHLEKVISLSEQGHNKGFMLVTTLLSKEKDKQLALSVMEELIETRRNDADALYAYSQLAMLVGELNKAREAVEKVRQIQPASADGHILYSNILIRQGKKTEAFAALHEAVSRYPDNTVLRHYYARRLVDEKRFADAREQYVRLLQVAPDNEEAPYALGLLAWQTRDLAEAESYFHKLIKQNKFVSESNYYLGQIAESRNQVDDAVATYGLVTNGQHYIEAQIRIALIEARKGEVQKARERLQDIQVDSAEMEVRLVLAEGELLQEAKMFKEAFEFYNETLAKAPENSQLLYARALAAEKIERTDISITDLTTIVKREPNNVQALNALGYTLVDRTENIKDGLAYIQKAYKLQPEDPAIIDSLGWGHYRSGNYVEALKYLRLAFEKLKDAEVAAHLGEVLWVIGEKDSARRIWDEALRDTPSHKALLDVINRFTK